MKYLLININYILISLCLFFIENLPAQTPQEDFTITEEMGFITHQMNGADFQTAITTFNEVIYYAYIDPSLRGKIVKKDANGIITEQVVIPEVAFNEHHTELSLAIDNEGYIHFVGNMHGEPMVYYRSDNPEDITSWTFYGNDVENGGIKGRNVSYPRFVKSRKGTLFLCYRSQGSLTNDGAVAGTRGGAIARYDTETKRWTSLGSLDYCFTNMHNKEVCGGQEEWGEVRNQELVIWDNSGSGDAPNNFYQGYKLRVIFDKNNRMHLAWNVFKNPVREPSDPAGASFGANGGTHVLYAYSDNEGNTWHQANRTTVNLPMTTENAGIVYKEENTGRFYNFLEITLDDIGNPIILQNNSRAGVVMVLKWNGSQWEKINFENGNWVNADTYFPVYWLGVACVDYYGVLTTFDGANRIHRSWDGGQTWQQYDIHDYEPNLISVDFDYLYQTGDLRIQSQYADTEVKVTTIDFISNDTLTPPPYSPFTEIIEETQNDIVISNFLSPNGDGQNDIWQIDSLPPNLEYQVKVFDKTGQVIFESNDYSNNSWDGTNNGQELPDGTYYYVITFSSTTEVKSGYITLLK